MDRDWAARLRGAGLRVTAGRVAALATLDEHPHSGIGDLTAAIRVRAGSASTQAVYDVLAALLSAGLIRRVEPAGQPPRYELESGDNHHHAICRTCGAMQDIACAVGHAPCLSAEGGDGFSVDEAEVIFWGTCRRCKKHTESA